VTEACTTEGYQEEASNSSVHCRRIEQSHREQQPRTTKPAGKEIPVDLVIR